MIIRLQGTRISLRYRRIKDFRFTLILRQNEILSEYLNKTSLITHLGFQIKSWFRNDHDFVVLNNEQRRIGTISLYNLLPSENSCEWGRWICTGNARENVESMMVLLKFAFEVLQLDSVFCCTKCDNVRISGFHSRLPYSSREKIVRQNTYFFKDTLTKEDWAEFKLTVGRFFI